VFPILKQLPLIVYPLLLLLLLPASLPSILTGAIGLFFDRVVFLAGESYIQRRWGT